MILEEGDLVALKEFYYLSPEKRHKSLAIVIEAQWKQCRIRTIYNGRPWWVQNNELKLLSGGSKSISKKV